MHLSYKLLTHVNIYITNKFLRELQATKKILTKYFSERFSTRRKTRKKNNPRLIKKKQIQNTYISLEIIASIKSFQVFIQKIKVHIWPHLRERIHQVFFKKLSQVPNLAFTINS